MATQQTPRSNRPDVGTRIGDVGLFDAHGSATTLGAQLSGITIVPIVRYYGCMPCRDFLIALEKLRERAERAGVGIVGIGKAADYQAQHLMDTDIGYGLLLDPEMNIYRAIELGHFPWWQMLNPLTWWKYLRAFRSARQGRITNHPLQAPGVVVLDADLTLRYVHRGRTIGDYPPAVDVLGAALAVVGD